jgi:HEPN domain-containing protein
LPAKAAEKLLKGFLVHASIDFGKTHDLEKLGQIVVVRFPPVERLVAAMRGWTNWNIAYRHPDIDEPVVLPTLEELTRALDLIANLAQMLRTLEPPADTAQPTMETNP